MTEAKKKAPAKKAEPKDPTVDELVAIAEKNIGNKHALLSVHWQNARDALVQVAEAEKRYDLLYGSGRLTEGKDANKNLPRDTDNRVE